MAFLRLFLCVGVLALSACDPVEGIPRKYGTDEPTDTGTDTDSAT